MSNLADEVMIPPKKRARHDNEEKNQDRLSDLPDCLILHILSFLNSKQAVQTCILSKRWKRRWKRIPTLILDSKKFPTVKYFSMFVSNILTLRDTSTALHALNFRHHRNVEPQLLKKVLNYIYSHNTHLQQLGIYLHGETCLVLRCISSCRALTSLKLSLYSRGSYNFDKTLFPKSLNLPALTSLDLTNFAFSGDENGHAEPFLTFTRLNSLVISSCIVKDAQILRISSETLVNLAMHDNSFPFTKIELSASSLCTFTINGCLDHKICGSGLSSVKHVNIDAQQNFVEKEHASVLLSWLLDLANVESLKVTSPIIQILFLVPDLLEVKLTSLCNLKLLEVKLIPLHYNLLFELMEEVMLKKAAAKSRKEAAKLRKEFKAGLKPPPIPDGIVDFLRQNSPSVEVNILTDYPSSFDLKQIEESIKAPKNTSCCSQFVVPYSSFDAPASAAEPSSAAPLDLHLCCAEKITFLTCILMDPL